MSTSRVRPRAAPARGELFVGREPELHDLRAALRRAKSGSGSIHTISGEPGIGKSRLARELAGFASGDGVRVLAGQGYQAGGVPPYWPWIQALHPLLEAATRRELAADWRTGADVALSLFPELASRLPDPEPFRSALDTDEGRRLRILDAVSAYLCRASRRQPLLVVLDDLHWADQDSLGLLLYLGRQVTENALLIVGIHRPLTGDAGHPLGSVLGELVKERLYQEHRLAGLSEAEVASYLHGAATDGSSPELAREIHRLTAGNPLYVSQLALHPVPAEAAATHLPEGLRSAIANRIAALPEHTRAVLEAASLLSADFRVELVASVLREPVSALLEALDQAVRAGLLREVDGRADRFDFVHVLIRDALAAGLPLDRRAALHARIGETLEAFCGAEAGAHAAELALHFVAARSVLGADRAARHCLTAARQALERQAWEETIRQAEAGTDVLAGRPMDDLQAELVLVRVISLSYLGRVTEEAQDSLVKAFEQFERSGNSRCGLEAATVTAYYLVKRLGRQSRDRLLRFASPGSSDAGRMLVNLGVGLLAHGVDFAGARVALQEALAIAEANHDVALRIRVYRAQATDGYQCDDLEGWAQAAASAAELAAEAKDPRAECLARISLSRALAITGRMREARSHLRRVLDIAESQGERLLLLEAWSLGVFLEFNGGDIEAARRYVGLYHTQTPPGRLADFDPDHIEMLIEYATGHMEEGNRILAKTLEGMQRVKAGLNMQTFWACLNLLEAADATGDTSNLATVGRWAQARASAAPLVPHYQQQVWDALTHVARLSGDLELAARMYETLRGKKLRPDEGHLQVSYGLLARMLGRMDEAVEHLRAARSGQSWSAWRVVEAIRELAQTLCMRDAPGDRQEARALWQEALERATRIGMVLEADRAREGLRRLDALEAGAARPSLPDGLTERELEVLELLAAGKTNKEIGWALCISGRTVEHHITRVFAKTGSTNRTEAAAYALRTGLVAQGPLDAREE